MLASTAYAGIESGKIKAEQCAGCHGLDGISLSPEIANLAGQKQQYLVNQLKAFRAKTRVNVTMNAMAESMDDEDIKSLTAYFSSLTRNPAGVTLRKVQPHGQLTRTEFPENTFISMKASATVEMFPDRSIWKGGPNMLYVAVTPDATRVLATSPSENTVYVFDAKSGSQLAVIPVGKAPKGVKVSPDGKQAYVSNQGSAEISVIDLDALMVKSTIAVREGPHNVRFSNDGRLAYVTLQGGSGIGVIDTRAGKMIRVIPVAGTKGPHNIDISNDGSTAFVRDITNHVAVVNLASGKVERIIRVGNGHAGIDVIPNGRYVVTGAIGDTYISVIDTRTFTVRKIEVGNGPHGIRASKDSRWIYVTVTKDNVVAIVSIATMQVVKKIDVGQFPFWVAVQGNP